MMLKIVSLIIWTTVYCGYQVELAIALEDNSSNSQNQIFLGDNRLPSQNGEIAQENLSAEGGDRQALALKAREPVTKILILAGLVSGVGIIGWQLSRQSQSVRSRPSLGKTSQKALIDRVSPKLRRQLLRLINDPQTANRLLMGMHQQHRDRDPNWLAEKVIYDLRRGR